MYDDFFTQPPATKRGRPAGSKNRTVENDSDDRDALNRIPSARGGLREGAGNTNPKGLLYVKAQESRDLDTARAKNEGIKAAINDIKLRVESKQWVNRADVSEEMSKAVAAFAQTMRSLPDKLERKHGLSPAIASVVSEVIDEALNSLADEFAKVEDES